MGGIGLSCTILVCTNSGGSSQTIDQVKCQVENIIDLEEELVLYEVRSNYSRNIVTLSSNIIM